MSRCEKDVKGEPTARPRGGTARPHPWPFHYIQPLKSNSAAIVVAPAVTFSGIAVPSLLVV